MATFVNTPSPWRRNPLAVVSPCNAARSVREARGTDVLTTPRCPTPHLDVDQYVRLLAGIEAEGGISTLDDIARALPTVARPVSAVFDLCDAGVLCADLAAPLDGGMRVWRAER